MPLYESYKESSRYTLSDCKLLSCVQINAYVDIFQIQSGIR